MASMPFDDADTQHFRLPSSSRRELPESPSSGVQVDLAGLSHPGKVRPNNEDHFLLIRFGRFIEVLQTNLPTEQFPSRFEDDGYGMAVADGVGGRVAGEEASRLAILTLVKLVLATPDWILRAEDASYAEEIKRRAAERFDRVNQALTEEAQADPQLEGFGTTMTLAGSVGRKLFLTHIGDSRAYLFRRGTLHQLTRDHTLAGELYAAGLLTHAQAATHYLRHALTRHLGSDSHAPADVQELTLESGDSLLLCSDGLSDMVSREEIAAVLTRGAPAKTLCERLVELALAAGGKDNVTALVAQYHITETI
jgi:PPM family protein phosphatase